MKLHKSIFFCLTSFLQFLTISQVCGIYDTEAYIPYLINKKVAVVVNQSSIIDNQHLIDSLISSDIHIESVFSPEHGFLGISPAGEYIDNSVYRNHLPIISLYGHSKRLNDEDLKNIDVLLFDIQDVGVRFYTYISTLHYVMEACARNNIKLIVLDRPNPHTHYVDGPVLKMDYQSFVGMHPVPIVYGMTIGEYAMMINGEGWLDNELICDLSIVKLTSYSRGDIINIPIAPSPNLRNMNAIFLYPSLCLFEGTLISIGRGTDLPFEMYGAPFFNTDFRFIPSPNLGSKNPKFNGELCYGINLENQNQENFQLNSTISLEFLIDGYSRTPDSLKSKFFNSFFPKLIGNDLLEQKIINHISENEIRLSWENDLRKFLMIREKYLLYN